MLLKAIEHDKNFIYLSAQVVNKVVYYVVDCCGQVRRFLDYIEATIYFDDLIEQSTHVGGYIVH